MVFFSYRTKCQSPAGDQFWKFSCQCSIFGRIGDQWVTISSLVLYYLNNLKCVMLPSPSCAICSESILSPWNDVNAPGLTISLLSESLLCTPFWLTSGCLCSISMQCSSVSQQPSEVILFRSFCKSSKIFELISVFGGDETRFSDTSSLKKQKSKLLRKDLNWANH